VSPLQVSVSLELG